MDRTLRRYSLIILLIPLKIGEILGNRIDMLFIKNIIKGFLSGYEDYTIIYM